MAHWSFLFLAGAVLAGLLGFWLLAETAAFVAKLLCYLFVAVFLWVFIRGFF